MTHVDLLDLSADWGDFQSGMNPPQTSYVPAVVRDAATYDESTGFVLDSNAPEHTIEPTIDHVTSAPTVDLAPAVEFAPVDLVAPAVEFTAPVDLVAPAVEFTAPVTCAPAVEFTTPVTSVPTVEFTAPVTPVPTIEFTAVRTDRSTGTDSAVDLSANDAALTHPSPSYGSTQQPQTPPEHGRASGISNLSAPSMEDLLGSIGAPSAPTNAPVRAATVPRYGGELFGDLDPVKSNRASVDSEDKTLPMVARSAIRSTAEPLFSSDDLDALAVTSRLSENGFAVYAAPVIEDAAPAVSSDDNLLGSMMAPASLSPVAIAPETSTSEPIAVASDTSPPVSTAPVITPAVSAAAAETAVGTSIPGLFSDECYPDSPHETRPAIQDDRVVLEDIEKKNILVYDKGEKHRVGWYADTCKADIREAILCACDAIMNSGFILRQVVDTNGEGEGSGERIFEFEDFDQLESGHSYILEPAKEREDLKDITGDRMRRLNIVVEPMLHVEAQKAIDAMRRGANLLKHTRFGFPHLRQFQLSDDKRRLLWYSGAKTKNDSVVQIEHIQEIMIGQHSSVFNNYRLPMLEHLSFSVKHLHGKTLDLTCKDEFEFDRWVTGLKALLYHSKNKLLSKAELLGHSKRFCKALKKNNCAIKLTTLPEVKEKGHVGLDDCIEIMSHTTSQLDCKLGRLRERLKVISAQVSKLDFHASAEMEVDVAILTGQGPAYASIFNEEEESQDEEMEIRRMVDLVDETSALLQNAQNELLELQKTAEPDNTGDDDNAKKQSAKRNKHVDQLLWKAEVDLENVEDMFIRHLDNQRETALPLSASIAEFNARVSQTAAGIGDELSKGLSSIKQWFT